MSTLKAVNFQHPSAVDPAIELESDGSIGGFLGTALDSKLPIAGGKILQIVRATDATNRATTSTSYVDASISVTITPQKSDSAILLVAIYLAKSPALDEVSIDVAITDSSNNLLSGSQLGRIVAAGSNSITAMQTLIAYSTPATTAATTYKLRFKVSDGTGTIRNADNTGQLYAIEVSA